jgi:hypothetical protein
VTEPTTETPKVEATPETPKAETVEQPEVFDPERAKATILAQRESEKNLKAQVKELAAKAKRADELEAAEAKRKEAEMSEADKALKRAEEAEAKLKALELTALKRSVADKVGLPVAFVDRLKGETEEELEADAKSLLEALPKAPKTTISPTHPGETLPQAITEAEQRERVYGNNNNLFDPSYLKSIGGGVRILDSAAKAAKVGK